MQIITNTSFKPFFTNIIVIYRSTFQRRLAKYIQSAVAKMISCIKLKNLFHSLLLHLSKFSDFIVLFLDLQEKVLQEAAPIVLIKKTRF